MNRNDEYLSLMKELEENTPDLTSSIQKAKRRKSRVAFLYRPLTGLAACFALFVLLINFSAPIAQACYQVPILGDLAKALTFSRSLSDAAGHDYMQQSDLVQENDGVNAKIEYIITDRKQVHIFYRLESNEYSAMYTVPDALSSDGTLEEPCTWTTPINEVSNDELRLITLDYLEEDVPDSLQLVIYVFNDASGSAEREHLITQFTFLLELDPNQIAEAIVYPLHQTVVMDGQTITITEIEVYPTHLRVNIEDNADNTAWLKTLDFYIETEDGRFDIPTRGIIATGSENSKSMTSFRADSIYFYQAEQIRLVITGARWLDKDMEKIRIDLRNGAENALPPGVTLVPAHSEESMSPVTLHIECGQNESHHLFLSMMYYDAAGTLCQTPVCFRDCREHGANCLHEWLELKDYPYDHIWICPSYTHSWIAEEPVVINIR